VVKNWWKKKSSGKKLVVQWVGGDVNYK